MATINRISTLDRHQNSDHLQQDAIQQLASRLEEVKYYLPIPCVMNFDIDNIILNFDTKNLKATNLDSLFNNLAEQFWFEKEIQYFFASSKGEFTHLSNSARRESLPINPPKFDGSILDAVIACHQLAVIILQKAPYIMDENLVRMWNRLNSQDSEHFKKLDHAAQIRIEMTKPEVSQRICKITKLDLTRCNLQFVPPEIHAFISVQNIYLYDSQLSAFPTYLSGFLPNLPLANVHFDYSHNSFLRGTYLIN